MRVIWKWRIDPPERSIFALEIPQGAQILDVQEQNGSPQLWALVDPSAPKQRYEFRIMPTGIEFESEETLHYVGTFQLRSQGLVFHLFEINRGN